MSFKPRGVCSREIQLEIDEHQIIRSCRFAGGCHGNAQGIARLVEGRPAQEVIDTLSGIKCGFKQTSCPDQLAKALTQMLEEQRESAAV
ncbi:TIGR03905 family TSCPD domain-containing protein [Oscillospiraceae bacterium NSJ-54]|uniref:ribonucleoside-diphosphate reductase n=2 Tax=Zongyangia hominis TaxID=2763677 RepID=A0A926EAZ8_9FIRM|nr:TIGR03905 family TSCPD domain-containing protein [Zongyangia hominis]